MSTQEAIDLLSHGSGLDSVEVSPSMIDVSKLCGKSVPLFLLYHLNKQLLDSGNLPLCLNIAGYLPLCLLFPLLMLLLTLHV
jgi:hypothetical protein